MSFESAYNHLKNFNLEDKVKVFESSSATVKEASDVLGCSEDEIAKTLSFLVGDQPILILVAGAQKIDNAKYKKEFGVKAQMISRENVEDVIGHVVGGVCPFGIKENVNVYLDVSLKNYEIVYPACGSGNSAVKLTIPELEKSSKYLKYVDVCKNIEQ